VSSDIELPNYQTLKEWP